MDRWRQKKKKTSTITPKWRRGNKHACALTMVNFRQTCGRYSWIQGLLGYVIGFNLFHFLTKLHLSKPKLNSASLAEFSQGGSPTANCWGRTYVDVRFGKDFIGGPPATFPRQDHTKLEVLVV